MKMNFYKIIFHLYQKMKMNLHNISLHIYMKKVEEQKRIYKWPIIGFKKQQKMEISKHNLDCLYENGEGAGKNLEKAFYWYQKSKRMVLKWHNTILHY